MYLQGQSIFLLKKKKKADLTEKNFCMMYHLEILISGGVFPILKAPSSKPWNILHLAIKILLTWYIKVVIDFPSSFSLLQQAIKDCFY